MEWRDFTIYVGIPAFMILVGWNGWLQKRLSVAEQDLSKFMIEVAKTYVTKADLQDLKREIMKRFDHLDREIDNVERRK